MAGTVDDFENVKASELLEKYVGKVTDLSVPLGIPGDRSLELQKQVVAVIRKEHEEYLSEEEVIQELKKLAKSGREYILCLLAYMVYKNIVDFALHLKEKGKSLEEVL